MATFQSINEWDFWMLMVHQFQCQADAIIVNQWITFCATFHLLQLYYSCSQPLDNYSKHTLFCTVKCTLCEPLDNFLYYISIVWSTAAVNHWITFSWMQCTGGVMKFSTVKLYVAQVLTALAGWIKNCAAEDDLYLYLYYLFCILLSTGVGSTSVRNMSCICIFCLFLCFVFCILYFKRYQCWLNGSTVS